MIIASKQRYLPVVINMIVLQKDDWYFYLHRDVYDQAVILADRYDQAPEELAEMIGGYDHNDDTVRWFYEYAPKPLHILAPCLRLIAGRIDPDLELVCGVLHVITSMIQVRQFILKPPEIRRSVSFSLTIKAEYEMAWERFFASSVPYDQRGFAMRQSGPGTLSVAAPAKPSMVTAPLIPQQKERTDPDDAPPVPYFVSTEEERSATRKLLMK
jgi:hypothetical protein